MRTLHLSVETCHVIIPCHFITSVISTVSVLLSSHVLLACMLYAFTYPYYCLSTYRHTHTFADGAF